MKVLVMGAAGRMGQRIIACLLEDKRLKLGGAVERSGHVKIGQDAGTVSGMDASGILITDDVETALKNSDVMIDFTAPQTTLANVELVAKHGKAIVIGTTGHELEVRKKIESYAQKIPMVMASNMSVGVNVLWKVIADAAKLLGSDYDIEVIETHHRLKKDAPSGTAMTTAEVLAEATGRDLSTDAVYHRQGLVGERTQKEIGIQTLRGGDVVGDHTVFFFGQGERLEFTHRASSRDTFARGSLRAAEWLKAKPAGLYLMKDVLGLK